MPGSENLTQHANRKTHLLRLSLSDKIKNFSNRINL